MGSEEMETYSVLHFTFSINKVEHGRNTKERFFYLIIQKAGDNKRITA